MLFADDSTLFVSGSSLESVLVMSRELVGGAQVWFDSNRLHLNHSKTHQITFSLRPIDLSDNPSQCVMYVKNNLNQYTSFSNVHSHDTRNKTDLVPQFHRVNSSRNGPNYFAIAMYNKIPENKRDLSVNQFKRYMVNTLKRKAYYNFDEFFCDIWE
ncbi:hypothetical protein M8J77_019447 [Diaphorina citri]|nr:hypothetical protein M8J77_019447 [Diaphorina citri]